MMLIWLAGTFIISYTLGSIPFGILLARAFGLGDLRNIGSGNIGATNALRTGNKLLAALTLFFDMAKGFIAVDLCRRFYGEDFGALAGFFAVLGHVFPVWLGFKGGKGVATALGVFAALNWMIVGTVVILWIAVFTITRISSVSSLMAIGYSSIAAYLFDDTVTALLCLCIGTLVVFTHRHNIIRLMGGHEHAFIKKVAT